MLVGEGALGGDFVEVEQAGAMRLSSPSSPVTHSTLGPRPAPGRRDLGVQQPGGVCVRAVLGWPRLR